MYTTMHYPYTSAQRETSVCMCRQSSAAPPALCYARLWSALPLRASLLAHSIRSGGSTQRTPCSTHAWCGVRVRCVLACATHAWCAVCAGVCYARMVCGVYGHVLRTHGVVCVCCVCGVGGVRCARWRENVNENILSVYGLRVSPEFLPLSPSFRV